MRVIYLLVFLVFGSSQGAPAPGFLGYHVNQVNLDNTFMTKPNSYDYSLNYPEYPLYQGLFRQDTPAFHSLKPTYPPHLYPYQAVFLVSTFGAPQQHAGSLAFRPRPDYPDVTGYVELNQPGPNVYTFDYIQTPEAPLPPLRPELPFGAYPAAPAAEVPAVQPNLAKDDMPVTPENDDSAMPTLDLNPYRLPLRPEEAPEEEPVVFKTVQVPAPSTDLNDDVKKIPIYVSSEEDSAEATANSNPDAEDKTVTEEDKSAVPSTDLYDDVKKIPMAPSESNDGDAPVTEIPSVAAGSAKEGEVETIEATTEAVASAETAVQDEGQTEIPETSTQASS